MLFLDKNGVSLLQTSQSSTVALPEIGKSLRPSCKVLWQAVEASHEKFGGIHGKEKHASSVLEHTGWSFCFFLTNAGYCPCPVAPASHISRPTSPSSPGELTRIDNICSWNSYASLLHLSRWVLLDNLKKCSRKNYTKCFLLAANASWHDLITSGRCYRSHVMQNVGLS